MMRTPHRVFLTLLALPLCLTASLAAQDDQVDPLRNFVSRDQLATLLVRWENAAQSPAYTDALRAQAQTEADGIRSRLETGDFTVGDRIYVSVAEETTLADTFTVDVGPMVDLPGVGEISLAGVLRLELQSYMQEQLARYFREPTVRARALLPVTVLGGVSRPGFYTMPSSATVTEVLNAAGLAATGDLAQIEIRRGETVLWAGAQLERAMIEQWTLDRLNLRAGDQVLVPAQPTNNAGGRGQVIQTVTLVLGIPFTIFGFINIFRGGNSGGGRRF